MGRPRGLDPAHRVCWATSAASSPTSRTTSSRPGSPRLPSPPRWRTSCPGRSDPNDIPTLVAYHRDGGLTEADLAAIDEQARGDRRRSTASPMRECSRRTARRHSRRGTSTHLTCSPRTARSPTPTSRSTWAKTAGTRSRSRVDEIREITEIDGVDVYVGGFGGQAYDFVSSFDGSQVTLLLITLRRGDPDPADHLPQPDPVDPADLLRRRGQHAWPAEWSTSWRSTPTSSSTTRASTS